MTKNMEELILTELFKLSDKVNEMATKMATKEDLKRFATKEDLKKYTTHEDLKKALDEQAKDIAEIFQNTFISLEKMNRQMEE